MLQPEDVKKRLTGIMPFVPTPFRPEDLELDLDGLRGNLRFLAERGVHSLGMCGFAGEFSSLTFEEYAAVIRAAVEEAAGKVLVIAGVGHGTKTAIRFAQHAQALGADCVMLLPPNVLDPPTEGLYRHLKAIAQSVDIAVMLHSMPGGATLNPETIARLAQLDNVVAYKDELRDIRGFHDIRTLVGDRLAYVSANGEKMIRYYFLDGMGALATAMGNFDPALVLAAYDAAATRDHARLNVLLKTKIEPWYRLREKNRAYLIAVTKESMNMVGLRAGVPRPPLTPITDTDRELLCGIMTQLGYLSSGDAAAVPLEAAV